MRARARARHPVPTRAQGVRWAPLFSNGAVGSSEPAARARADPGDGARARRRGAPRRVAGGAGAAALATASAAVDEGVGDALPAPEESIAESIADSAMNQLGVRGWLEDLL